MAEEKSWFNFKRREDGGWTLEHQPARSISEFETHLRNSGREFLLAWRHLMDHLIESLEKKEEKKKRREGKEIRDINIEGE